MEIIYLDLETADADELYTCGEGFVRLAGYAIGNGPLVTTTDIPALVRLISQAGLVVGHNILSFDLPALERYYGLDLAKLVREKRVIDTLLTVRQNDPPLSSKVDSRRYGLDAIAQRLGLGGKLPSGDGGSVLEALRAEYGGYDRIPVDHPEYLRYLRKDVELVRELARVLRVDDYLFREHEVTYRLNHITKHGFRVDVKLAQRLVGEQGVRVLEHKRALHERYGLPMEGKRPHTTNAGKEALERAFRDLDVEPIRTSKGALATGKDALCELEARHPANDALLELCGTLRAFNGERSTAQTILDNTGPDGRVRPSVAATQATGRVSTTKPGLSVMGKRDRGNVCERALLLADEGHVLISADLSQIDARAMAAHSQDPAYISALEKGKDMHSEMAATLFGEEGWDRSAGHHPRRDDAKAITHATTYGMGPASMAGRVGISETEAAHQLALLEVKFPALASFKRAIREEARAQVIENAFGRRMRVLPGREHTQAPAHVGQGTARDLMMEGVLRLPDWLLPCLRAIVHDEIVLSVPIERADEGEAAVLKALQFVFTIRDGATPVPVYAEKSERGRDWADCYRTEKANWPEVARSHRELPDCDDTACTWHVSSPALAGAYRAPITKPEDADAPRALLLADGDVEPGERVMLREKPGQIWAVWCDDESPLPPPEQFVEGQPYEIPVIVAGKIEL
ncbi:DNA polymerase [Microbacterium sp. NPDC076911]|uniref:DNA polymerase n=1 Tax=Microbacterium sp. NPDC076911 TaxID=3154958 RepID=UPI00342819A2